MPRFLRSNEPPVYVCLTWKDGSKAFFTVESYCRLPRAAYEETTATLVAANHQQMKEDNGLEERTKARLALLEARTSLH